MLLSLVKFLGASGTTESLRIAPLPYVEITEEPIALIATTLAKILVPAVRLNGDYISLVTAIEHDFAAITEATEPSQMVMSSV